ncbi:CTP synthase C-terminal region-related (seleno)protein [Phytohalomonas tamaricis]|uniref:CTP synthase C-terminal region-related (seleno)protein n=1 Tax=Phytohalomonas tamaricis TaxID=2081032 RepID=UPI000D0AC174|nr:CTP synthase [Phytohalomonas tamaricis]
MNNPVSIGLVGDYDPTVPAHQAIPLALNQAGDELGIEVRAEWLPTEHITAPSQFLKFDALWCVPATPYRSMEGALFAIRHARENGVPFLGTCGGFQHAVIEYARNVLNWQDAEHAESTPDATRAVITPLQCALVEVNDTVRLFSGTKLATAYAASETSEGYRCRYGINPEFQAALVAGPLRASADDHSEEIRAIELDGHPFFVATLFQPERAALKHERAPLIVAFVKAASQINLFAPADVQ